MEMTRNEFYKWAKQRVQWTDNDLLYPHNPDIADAEVVDVIAWSDFVDLIYQLTEGKIVIKEMQTKSNDGSTRVFYVGRGGDSRNFLNVDEGIEHPTFVSREDATPFATYAAAEEYAEMMPADTSYIIIEGYV